MQQSTLSTDALRRRGRRSQRVEFGFIYALSFLALLVAFGVTRLIDLVTRRRREAPVRSIIQEARATAGATIPYAFMG